MNLTEKLNEYKNKYNSIFAAIQYTETKIDILSAKHPNRAREIYSAFSACYPSKRLLEIDGFWKSHIDEILERAVTDESLFEPTNAEIVISISDASLKSPLTLESQEVAFLCASRMDCETANLISSSYSENFTHAAYEELERIKRQWRINRDYDFTSWNEKQMEDKNDNN